jgi:hypothetical protein
VLVSDFGLAKMADVSKVTLTGALLGSPDFMSPEQARGEAAEAVSDLFSVSSVFYFLITGTRPFTRNSPLATLAAVSDGAYEPAQRRNPKISPDLVRILRKGLAKNPKDRFASATEYRQAILEYLEGIHLKPEEFSFANWMASPTDVTMRALNDIASALSARCQKQIDSGAWNDAIQTLSHLSLVAPESAASARLLQELETARSRMRRKRIYIPLAALLFVAAFGASAVLRLVNRPGAAPTVTIRGSSPPPIPVAAKTTPSIGPSIGKGVKANPRLPAQPDRVAPVKFDVPKDITVYWDGKNVTGMPLLPGQKMGTHRLRLEKPGSTPIEQEIRVKSGEPTVIAVQ